jgi:hypothetical protein
MNISNVIKGFAAIIVSFTGSGVDNEEQVPLWAAIVVSIIGLALVVLLTIVGWSLLGF